MAFCPGCGRQVRASPHRSEYVAPAHVPSGRRTGGEKSVAPFISLIIILIVTLPLLLFTMLYLGVIGDDSSEPEQVTTELTVSPESNGFRLTFGPFSTQTEWDDIVLVLSGDSSSVSWGPPTSALEGPAPAVLEFAPDLLGSITVFCNVTDVDGDGWIDDGDFFTIQTGSEHRFSSDTEYSLLVAHERLGTLAASVSFSGP